MANNKLLQQMLESLVNDDQAKAEELFHEYVVEASREIYESMIDSEIAEEKDEDEDMEESMDSDEEDMEEGFEDIAVEADDEMDLDHEDPTDDLAGDMMGPEEGEHEENSEEELFQDLESIVDELQAKFDELKGMEHDEHEMDGDSGEEEMESMGDLATVREYVEKVPAGHGAEKKGAAEKADNKKSTIDNMKNDMGGTTANILSSKESNDGGVGAGGTIKGSALSDTKPKDMNTGNINVPGANAGKTAFKKKEPGHGAEKKGAAEGSTDGQSLFRGRR